MESQNNPLFNRIREDFRFFGGVSLIFGILGTLLFYRAGIGLNSFIYSIILVVLLVLISKRLNVSIPKQVVFYFSGTILLGLSNVLTSSYALRFLNNIGILLLLDVSLIKLFSINQFPGFIEGLLNILALPFKALTSIGMFFVDGNLYAKNKKVLKNDILRNILIGCVIAIPILLITTSLLSSADLLYGKITGSIFSWILKYDFYIVFILIVLGTLFCYSLLCGVTKDTASTERKNINASATIGITITSIMLLSYILFCGIQLLYLFAGGLFVLPEEFTYAEYARRGFFELLTVTSINIILIIICEKVFEANKVLRILLTVITGCTYIMIFSAAYRMFLYIGAYHLTFLRLFVLLFLIIDAFVLAGVIISLYYKNFPLFEYSVIVVTLCYLVFSFSRPDYHIAKYFINHTDKIESEDIYFLTTDLSYDAAEVVIPILEKQYDFDISSQKDYYYNPITDTSSWDIREYNYSLSKAMKLVKKQSLTNK